MQWNFTNEIRQPINRPKLVACIESVLASFIGVEYPKIGLFRVLLLILYNLQRMHVKLMAFKLSLWGEANSSSYNNVKNMTRIHFATNARQKQEEEMEKYAPKTHVQTCHEDDCATMTIQRAIVIRIV